MFLALSEEQEGLHAEFPERTGVLRFYSCRIKGSGKGVVNMMTWKPAVDREVVPLAACTQESMCSSPLQGWSFLKSLVHFQCGNVAVFGDTLMCRWFNTVEVWSLSHLISLCFIDFLERDESSLK